MAVYLHLFDTETEYQDKRSNDYYEPWVSYTEEAERTDYNKSEHERMYDEYLTFEMLEAGDVKWMATVARIAKTIDYRVNDGEWTSITSASGYTSAPTISVQSGDIVQFKGTNTEYGTAGSNVYVQQLQYNHFVSTADFIVKGNIMSMLYGDNFIGQTTISSRWTFPCFFSTQHLIKADNLILPAMKFNVTSGWNYYGMFSGATDLTVAPELPATGLTRGCYANMFEGCTSLVQAPAELPASASVGNWCYYRMFANCPSLTQGPVICLNTFPYPPGTEQGEMTYMFCGCTSLNTVKCYIRSGLDYSGVSTAYPKAWMYGVSPTGTFYKPVRVYPDWQRNSDGIPSGWSTETITD